MISTISNSNNYNNSPVSFQAKLVTEIPIKDAKKLLNVKKLFEEKSQHYKYDTLTVGKSLDPDFDEYVAVRTSDAITCGEYKYSHIIEDFDEIFENLSENEIVKKLLSYFKVMKKEEQFDNRAHGFNSKIDRISHSRKQNIKDAKYYRKKENTRYAARHEALAANYQAKLDKLQEEKIKRLNRIASDMDKTIGNNTELSHVPETYLDVEQIPRL